MTKLVPDSNPPQPTAASVAETRQQIECATILSAFRTEHLSEDEAIKRLREVLVPSLAMDGDREREAKRFIFSKGYESAEDSIDVLVAAKLMVEFAGLSEKGRR